MKAVTRQDLPLAQQPTDIDKVTAEAIEKHVKPLTDVKKKNKVVIVIRRSQSTVGCVVDKELLDEFDLESSKTKFGVPVKQLTHCLAAGRNYKYIDGEGLTRSYIDNETELVVILADDTDRKQLYTELIETAMAHVSDGDVLAVIASTTIRINAIREAFKTVQIECDQTNTKMITAEESTERMVDSMENEHKRLNALGSRTATYNRKETKMRAALHPNNESLSTFASNHISNRKIKSSQYLFQPTLQYVLKNELGTRKESNRLSSQKWRDRQKQQQEDREVILDKLRHKQLKFILALADNASQETTSPEIGKLLSRSINDIPNVQYSRGNNKRGDVGDEYTWYEKERIKIGRVEAMIKQLEYENTLLMEYGKQYNLFLQRQQT